MALTNPFTAIAQYWNAMRTAPVNPQRGGRLMYIGSNNAGVNVTPEIAFQVSAVWACIDAISSAIASSNWDVYEWDGQNNKQELLPTDPMQQTLNVRWNPEMTAKAGKQAVMIAAVSWGNGYAEIVRDMAGRPVELWPISPDRVEARRSTETGALYWQVQNDYGGMVDLEMRDMFHVPGPGITGLLGDNMIAKSVRTIALTIAMERFTEAYFGNGTQLGGVLEYPHKLDDPAYARLKDQWNSKHRGPSKAFQTAIIDNGAKWTQIDASADKAQLIEGRYQQVEEICRWFKVPPHKIAHLLRATNNNIEHQGLEFSRDTLRPWKRVIEEEGEYKLFSKRGRPRFICVDTAWAAEGDFKSRMEGYQIGRAMGVYSVNDILRKLGENTIGKEGDIRTMNGASVRLEDVGKNMLPGSAPSSAPAKPAPAAVPDDEQAPEAILQAWLTNVYQRIEKRQENRQSKTGAYAYASECLNGVEAAIEARWPGARASMDAGADRVINGEAAIVVASQIIESLKATA